MRSYVLAGNTAHYDGVIAALEARGLRWSRPSPAVSTRARDRRFFRQGRPADGRRRRLAHRLLAGRRPGLQRFASAAKTCWPRLDVPYLSAIAVEFQTLEQWEAGENGLMPVETTMMVAIPEIDGARADPLRRPRPERGRMRRRRRDMNAHPERAAMLAARVKSWSPAPHERAERKVAIVLFNFPPNGGATGTAAYLSVFARCSTR
jgi:magnesium chelatase subunit H